MSRKPVVAMIFIIINLLVALVVMATTDKWFAGVPSLFLALGIASGYLLSVGSNKENAR